MRYANLILTVVLQAPHSTKFDLNWRSRQLREVRIKSCKSAPEPALSDDALDSEGAGSANKEPPCADEEDLKRGMRLQYEVEIRASQNVQAAVQPDQLEECLEEPSVPYVSDDNTSQQGVLEYWNRKTSQYPDLARMWRQFHAWPASGRGIERVFTDAEKQLICPCPFTQSALPICRTHLPRPPRARQGS